MEPKEIQNIRIQQSQNLFSFMLEQKTLLVCAITANPESPAASLQFMKTPVFTDKQVAMLLRKQAEALENGTAKITYKG
jgi:hypothetical protein